MGTSDFQSPVILRRLATSIANSQRDRQLLNSVQTAPISRQLAGRRFCKYALPKPLEQRADAVQAVAARVHAGEQGIELVGDALLFREGCNGEQELSYALWLSPR